MLVLYRTLISFLFALALQLFAGWW